LWGLESGNSHKLGSQNTLVRNFTVASLIAGLDGAAFAYGGSQSRNQNSLAPARAGTTDVSPGSASGRSGDPQSDKPVNGSGRGEVESG